MAIVALVVAGAMGVAAYEFRKRQLVSDFQTFVRGVAGTAALSLHGEDIAAVHDNADTTAPAFTRPKNVLARVRDINGLSDREVTVLRPTSADSFSERGDGQTEFVVMLQPEVCVGSPYMIPAQNRAAIGDAWKNGEPRSTGLYTDEHGSWISGYAPIMDAAGKPVAIVQVDAELTRLMAKLHSEQLLALAIGAGAFALAMAPGLLLAGSVTRGLRRLSEGIRRFQAGDYESRVSISTHDEIREVGEVFNDMIVSLAERLALLPYVSRFTAEAVRKGRSDPSWLMGTEQRVVVLFADLRGFTRFSEDREATRLVRELNGLLAVQAEIVISAGGDVDKFIGDRVMAVFLDQASDESVRQQQAAMPLRDAAARAFGCASDLIRQVRAVTDANAWELGLGVGLHVGEAVVGSIGSDQRRDFTAVGHTVNLASRLCDHAPAWEVLASEAFYSLLDDPARANCRRTEPMHFKNVAQPVATWACSPA